MTNPSTTSPPASASTSAPAVPAASVGAAASTSESLGVVPSTTTTPAVSTASSSRQVAPWRRYFEEGLELLNQEEEAKRIRLAAINSEIEELVRERNAVADDLEKLDEREKERVIRDLDL